MHTNEERKMKILYIIGSLEVGGAEKHLVNLIINLKTRGWTPELYSLSGEGPLKSELEKFGIPIYSPIPPEWLRSCIDKIQKKRWKSCLKLVVALFFVSYLLWKRRPYILHCFLPDSYLVGGISFLVSPVRNLIMSRRSLNHYQNESRILGIIERMLHHSLTFACANSKAVLNDLINEGISQEKIRLTYNGIDTKVYEGKFNKVQSRLDEDIPEDTLVLIIVANLIPYKGHLDLLHAIYKIHDSLPKPWILLCVGRDDGIQQSLNLEATKLGIHKNIRFLGSRSDVPNLLRLSDIGILCSHQEGFSNAILEGMAAGLSMVVTAVGGNAEAVLDGKTGMIVPAHNPDELSKAILTLSLNKILREKFGCSGKQRVENFFRLEACIDNYEKLYKEITLG